MHARSRILSRRIALALALAAGAGPGHAQSVPQGDSQLVEEIIVSATRREESIQSVPVSINAFSGESLANAGWVSVGQFLDSVPGVTGLAEGAGQNVVIIRNVATSTQEQGGAVTATYLDDFAISSPSGGAPEIRLVDMERVEVLKGPQGTLFGRSAMGGIVRYISNKPDATQLQGGINTYTSQTTDGGDNFGGHAYLNLPITDQLAARFVAYAYENDGFIDNVELGIKDYNEESTTGGRAALRWQASDTLSFDLTALYQKIDAAPNWVSTVHSPSGDIPFDIEGRTAGGAIEMDVENESQYVNFRADKQFDPFSVTFLATHAREKLYFVFDQREFVGLTQGCVCELDADVPRRDDQTDILELRLVSPKDQLIDYIAGLYYENSESDTQQFIQYFGPNQTIFGGFLTLTNGLVAIDTVGYAEGKEKAAYGEVGFNVTGSTRLALGMRRSEVEYAFTQTKAGGIFTILTGGALNEGIRFSTKEPVRTYKFTVEQKFTDDLFGYVLASSGYRRGGFNQPTIISPFSTYDSDSLWNYEIGLKSTWLDGRLIANGAIFYLDFDDMQLVVQDPFTFVRSTQNVGRAGIPGVELSLAMPIGNSVTLAANGSWSDPELRENVPGNSSGRKGDRLPGSATKSYSLMANLNHPIGNGFNLTGLASYKFVGERLNDFNRTLDVALASYDVLDLRLGLRSDSGYSVSLFADNVLDEAATLRIDRQGPRTEVAPTNRPRTVGLNFTYDF